MTIAVARANPSAHGHHASAGAGAGRYTVEVLDRFAQLVDRGVVNDGCHGEHENTPATCQLWEMQIQSVPISVLSHVKHSESLRWAGSAGFTVSTVVSMAEHLPDPTPVAHGGRTRAEPAAASLVPAASGAVEEQDQSPSVPIRQDPTIVGIAPEWSSGSVLTPQPGAAATRTHVRQRMSASLAIARATVTRLRASPRLKTDQCLIVYVESEAALTARFAS